VFSFDVSPARWEPERTLATWVMPRHLFFNGMSYFYKFGTRTNTEPGDQFLLAGPLGSIKDKDAKICAFKLHEAWLGVEEATTRILPVKSQILWSTGNIDSALQQGAEDVGWTYSGHYFINTQRYLALYHQVPPREQALSCSACHEGGGRLDFAALGYTLKADQDKLCARCHMRGEKALGFYEIHAVHVDEENRNCSNCHKFN
jgi:predicted CXXCH cytochrome family protein